jgi:hypothetical protein
VSVDISPTQELDVRWYEPRHEEGLVTRYRESEYWDTTGLLAG